MNSSKVQLAQLKKLIDIFTAVDKVVKNIAAFEKGQNVTIDLGDYSFNDVKGASTDPADSTSNATDISASDPSVTAAPATQTAAQQLAENKEANPQTKNLLSSLTSIPGLDFEVLNPITVLRILLGEQNVDLVKFDVPDLDLIFPFTTGEQVLGYVVPPGLEVTGRFDANAKLKTDLFVGFDTGGLELWSEDDFALGDSYKVSMVSISEMAKIRMKTISSSLMKIVTS
ncbi:MAG: hypothetical protein HC930_12630 [Hydrococcus sp. SU_1_0]|nr:hypothetical protein [Hydrococcus sp. SU_1_0]